MNDERMSSFLGELAGQIRFDISDLGGEEGPSTCGTATVEWRSGVGCAGNGEKMDD